MADANSNMPLANELQLVNYLQSMLTGKTINPNYTGATVQTAQMVPTMSGADMNSIMTEWLRGNGQFLDHMRQQNVAGLYNTSTQKLLANDLTAQAALKAAQANIQIQQGNANLMNQYYSRLQAQQPKYLPSQGGLGKTAAAAGIAGLDKLLGGVLGTQKGKKDPRVIDESGATKGSSSTESSSPDTSAIDTSSLSSAPLQDVLDAGSLALTNPQIAEAYDFGQNMSIDPAMTSAWDQLLGIDTPMMSTVESPYFSSSIDLNGWDMSSWEMPAVDTYQSFYDSYGTTPGYDFVDYSDYSFDW